MAKTGWKILKKGMVSNANNNFKWKKNKWYKHEGEISLCKSGFHGSKFLVDAIRYVIPGVICKVEYKGKIIEGDDKFVASEMRVIDTFRLTKRQWVKFAIYCAKSCLKNFEEFFPNDMRPREAILAAKKWLKNPSKKNKSAASSAAWSAWSAAATRPAASSAAWSAWSAESAAESVICSVDSAIQSAAQSVDSAIRSVAQSAAKKKMSNYLIKIMKEKR